MFHLGDDGEFDLDLGERKVSKKLSHVLLAVETIVDNG